MQSRVTRKRCESENARVQTCNAQNGTLHVTALSIPELNSGIATESCIARRKIFYFTSTLCIPGTVPGTVQSACIASVSALGDAFLLLLFIHSLQLMRCIS